MRRAERAEGKSSAGGASVKGLINALKTPPAHRSPEHLEVIKAADAERETVRPELEYSEADLKKARFKERAAREMAIEGACASGANAKASAAALRKPR